MQLATWNCQTGLASNWDAIEQLGVDVLSLQECGPETEEEAIERGGWGAYWQRGRYEKGVAALARSPYRLEVRERSEPCLVSAIVSGPHGSRLRFVGFWAMTPTPGGADTYPQQATWLIEQLPDDGIPTVVAGDFNASWRNRHHLRNVESLAERGLVSAYHSFFDVPHDVAPPQPTSYFQWNRERPYHMDFVFVPDTWVIRSVEVGTFEDYPAARGLSDHVPVTVSVDAPISTET